MRRFLNRYTRGQVILFALVLLILLIGMGMLVLERQPAAPATPAEITPDTSGEKPENIVAKRKSNPEQERGQQQQPETPKAPEVSPVQKYRIKQGDTLSAIFEAKGLSATVLHYLLVADTEYLSLETLKPGKMLTFRFDDERTLESLTLHVDLARTVVFSRQDDGSFDYQKIEATTHWESETVTGITKGSFYASGLKAGLSMRQVAELSHLLKGKLNFRRDLRAGDQFEVVVDHEMTGQEATGRTRIDAVSLQRGKNTYNAFLYDDGSYYDETGAGILPAFRRWPTSRHYRVTSSFDLHRLHPITGRKAPHNGVDLAVPFGTSVMSTGDGVVSRIGNHPYAGKYIDIEHSGSFSTRYLHLSKILVKRGERVKRGQKIASSGNTGRTTGPHLHFELHINGNPANPLTTDIPISKRIPKDEMEAFRSQVRKQMALLHSTNDDNADIADEASATSQNQAEKGG